MAAVTRIESMAKRGWYAEHDGEMLPSADVFFQELR
jgi:hypothetical protein